MKIVLKIDSKIKESIIKKWDEKYFDMIVWGLHHHFESKLTALSEQLQSIYHRELDIDTTQFSDCFHIVIAFDGYLSSTYTLTYQIYTAYRDDREADPATLDYFCLNPGKPFILTGFLNLEEDNIWTQWCDKTTICAQKVAEEASRVACLKIVSDFARQGTKGMKLDSAIHASCKLFKSKKEGQNFSRKLAALAE